jgi:hypothetical protein
MRADPPIGEQGVRAEIVRRFNIGTKLRVFGTGRPAPAEEVIPHFRVCGERLWSRGSESAVSTIGLSVKIGHVTPRSLRWRGPGQVALTREAPIPEHSHAPQGEVVPEPWR